MWLILLLFHWDSGCNTPSASLACSTKRLTRAHGPPNGTVYTMVLCHSSRHSRCSTIKSSPQRRTETHIMPSFTGNGEVSVRIIYCYLLLCRVGCETPKQSINQWLINSWLKVFWCAMLWASHSELVSINRNDPMMKFIRANLRVNCWTGSRVNGDWTR